MNYREHKQRITEICFNCKTEYIINPTSNAFHTNKKCKANLYNNDIAKTRNKKFINPKNDTEIYI